ncbi:MAG: AsmA-like C-terminal region-containing protein [Paludibacter sp.]|nr:AsmA-like C-terminal region-containing protein [Paludibacter sp.]
MKKFLKTAAIAVTALIIVLLITISVIVWIVFTPSKLTPIVRQQADKYISCPSKIGSVELTFFSSFPQFSLKITNLALINPIARAQSDTLLSSQTVYAALDLRALWKNNELIMHDLQLNHSVVNLYVDKTGKANYDVYKSDTTIKDTSAFKNPFARIDIQKVVLRDAQISYIDLSSDMQAQLKNVDGQLGIEMKGDNLNALLDATSPEVSFRMDSTEYFKKTATKVNIPLQYQFNKKLLTLTSAKVVLNGLIANIDGTIKNNQNNGDMVSDLRFTTENYQLKPFLKMVPAKYSSKLEGVEMDGLVNTKGTVTGIYNQTHYPVVDMNVQVDKGTFQYAGFSYKLREITGNVDVLVDLNDEMASKVIINDAKAKTGQSNLQAKGFVDYIMADDMLFDLDMKMDLNLPELEPMLPDGMAIKLGGAASGNAKARFMLSDAMNFAFDKMNISGKFDATNLVMKYDSLTMSSEKAKLDLVMPNTKNKSAKYLQAGLWCNRMIVHKGNSIAATIFNANMLAETSDITRTEQMNTINCDFNFDQMSASMDNMTANLEKSKGKLQMKANFSDTVSVPTINCDFDVQSLVAAMDTMSVKINYPKGQFAMSGDKLHSDQTVFDLNYTSVATTARMGSQSIDAKQMIVKANIKQNDKEENMMLKWIPTGYISMEQGKIKANGLNADIEIPSIQFDFTPDEYTIKKSQFIVDNSDFSLTGKLWNVNEYLHDKGLLKGDFNFTSNTTDVHRLMELTNGFGVETQDSIIVAEAGTATKTVTKETTKSAETSSGPYMVPKGLDLKLHAQINRALLGYDSAQNVLGDLFVKDGLLVLQDMRFKTSAAKMQLTAMYRTPRKNHLFVGLDFHMTDMEISELLKMIPDIDTIMPMLRSFGGKGEFHIAVETYLDSMYNMKRSTLRGVSSVKGEDLVLMDGETFSEIAKKLRFNKKTQNKVDSLSAEFTIFKNEVDVYPFLIVMDKYKAVVGGRHNLDMTFDYNISLIDSPLPLQLGVDVKGSIGDMKISLGKCKYANLYRPVQRREIDTKQLEIRKMIRDALTKEVIK